MVRAVDRANPQLNGTVFVLENGEPHEVAGGELSCERIYFAGGSGLCLATAESGIEYEAKILDKDLEPVHSLKLAGIPSRARVSRDGRYGAMTVFVNGHAYLSGGGFSTATTIVDMEFRQEPRQPRDLQDLQGRRPARSRRLQLLGRDICGRPECLLRDAANRRPLLPRRRQHRPPGNAGSARSRRVPIALTRRNQDRLQESDRGRKPLASAKSST